MARIGGLRLALYARAGAFVALFSTAQIVWQRLHGTSVEYFVVHFCTVAPAAQIVNWLTPAVHAQAVGFLLQAQRGGLNIINGCDGVDALLLLGAALFVSPGSWRWRAFGMALGVAVVFIANQARILALFYAYRADRAMFDALHEIVGPITVILIVAGYVYAWFERSPDSP